jgi:uncharacterized protein with HEPN domain
MKHPERVEDYLEHIAEAIERATGESVNKINSAAPDFIKQHPELPWGQMRAMRNVAIHEYFLSIWK